MLSGAADVLLDSVYDIMRAAAGGERVDSFWGVLVIGLVCSCFRGAARTCSRRHVVKCDN